MSILRKVNRENFTTVENDILEDERLSYRARGIAVYLLSKPDNWTINMKHLVRHGSEGLHAIRTALHELAEHGYLKRVRYYEDGKVMTLTQIADFPAFAHDGTTEQRINGYEPNVNQPDVQAIDMSKTDMSETEMSETDMSETDTQVVNTDAVNTDVTNTDKGGDGAKATAVNRNGKPSDDESHANAFASMLEELRQATPRGAPDYASMLSLQSVLDDGEYLVFTAGIMDHKARDWIQQRYSKTMYRSLQSMISQPVALEFVLMEAA